MVLVQLSAHIYRFSSLLYARTYGQKLNYLLVLNIFKNLPHLLDLPDLNNFLDLPGLPDIADLPDLSDLSDLPDLPHLPDIPHFPNSQIFKISKISKISNPKSPNLKNFNRKISNLIFIVKFNNLKRFQIIMSKFRETVGHLWA